MATLSGLEIGSLTLNPSFQPDVYDYTATRAQGDTSTGTIKLTKTHNSSVIGQGMIFGSATHIGPHSRTTTFINNPSQSGENPATRNGVDYRTTTTQLSFMVSNGNDSREYTVVIGRTSVTAIAEQDVVAIGDTAVLTAEIVDGSGTPTYQWQISQNGGLNWYNSVLTGNKTDTLTFVADNARIGRLYRCAVTDDNGTWYSNVVQLTKAYDVATLDNIEIGSLTLSPAFQPDVTTYNVTLPSGVTHLTETISLTKQNINSSVGDSGHGLISWNRVNDLYTDNGFIGSYSPSGELSAQAQIDLDVGMATSLAIVSQTSDDRKQYVVHIYQSN